MYYTGDDILSEAGKGAKLHRCMKCKEKLSQQPAHLKPSRTTKTKPQPNEKYATATSYIFYSSIILLFPPCCVYKYFSMLILTLENAATQSASAGK